MTNDQAIYDAYVSGTSSDLVGKQFNISGQTVLNAVRRIDPSKVRKRGTRNQVILASALETVTPEDIARLNEVVPDSDFADYKPTTDVGW